MPAKRKNRRRAQSRRGALALALICALALASGFALDALMPPGGAADEAAAASDSSLRLSEVMASNASAHRDASGAFCDWVELVNTGAQPESVGGFRLVDGENVLAPLTLPDIAIGPGEHLLIYCDGAEQNAAGGELHAPFRIDADGAALALYDEDGALADAVDAPALTANEVYRRDEATGIWQVSGEYTPGLANTREMHLSLEAEESDSPLVLTEASSANRTYAPDASGVCHDYIELHNPSAQEIDLTGYCLTDDESDPGKWVFPQGAAIPAGGYLLIYASGGAAGAAGELHASFKLDSAGDAALDCDPEGYAVCRLPLPALQSDQAYSLGVDGEYTAALAPTPGLPNDSIEPRLQVARANAGGVYISEVMASPDDQPHDWLEVYNASSQAADISGWGLSDDAASPRKYRFPQGTVIAPGDHLTLYLSGTAGTTNGGVLCASLRLSADGGYGLTLSGRLRHAAGPRVRAEQYTGISYARMEDGNFLYTTQDTPDRANAQTGCQGRTQAPAFSAPGGPQAAPLQVELTAAPGARIFYTLDCSAPDEASTPYAGPIPVTDTAIVRAVAYQEGYLPSYSASQSYLYGAEHTMRVVSMVADPDDIFGPEGFPHALPAAAGAPRPHRGLYRGGRADALGKLRPAPARARQPFHGAEGLQGHRPRRIRGKPLPRAPVHAAGL